MMDWIQILSYLFTNEVRLLLGLYLVSKLTDFSLERKALLLAGVGGCLVTVLQAISLPFIGVIDHGCLGGKFIVSGHMRIKPRGVKAPELTAEKVELSFITRPYRNGHVVCERLAHYAARVEHAVGDVEVKVNAASHNALLGHGSHLMQKHHQKRHGATRGVSVFAAAVSGGGHVQMRPSCFFTHKLGKERGSNTAARDAAGAAVDAIGHFAL